MFFFLDTAITILVFTFASHDAVVFPVIAVTIFMINRVSFAMFFLMAAGSTLILTCSMTFLVISIFVFFFGISAVACISFEALRSVFRISVVRTAINMLVRATFSIGFCFLVTTARTPTGTVLLTVQAAHWSWLPFVCFFTKLNPLILRGISYRNPDVRFTRIASTIVGSTFWAHLMQITDMLASCFAFSLCFVV